jgi:hypothetical protein
MGLATWVEAAAAHAMRQIKPDSRGLGPAIHVFSLGPSQAPSMNQPTDLSV